jgi:hypothetical protein
MTPEHNARNSRRREKLIDESPLEDSNFEFVSDFGFRVCRPSSWKIEFCAPPMQDVSMKTGNLQSAASRIQEALDDLNAAWERTRESWMDERAADFEATVLRKIAEEISSAFPAIGQMSQTLNAAVRECDE